MLGWILAATAPGQAERLELPLRRLRELSWLDALLSYPPVKALLPIPILAALAPVVIWFFGKWWREINREVEADLKREDLEHLRVARPRRAAWLFRAHRGERLLRLWPLGHRAKPLERPFDYRPAACMLITGVVLTLQEYYGGREFFERIVKPWLVELEAGGAKYIQLAKFDDLWSHTWWVVCRVVGYVFIPFSLWRLLFPRDKLRDMGLRVTGLRQHLWIYGLCLAVVVPTMLIVASQPDFGTYYPFYKLSSRSYLDFALWESMYWVQFLALEMFFRGWILGALRRTMGAAAIFAMAVPYCMIHYGKPYLEAHGAIVAGIVLGTLAMRTRSVYLGFLVHITVAFSMDFLALSKRGALPTVLWPPG